MTPTQTISRQAWMADPDLQAVFATLQGAGDPDPAVLCAGGCVRDALMDRPVVDVDLATVHPPDIVMARLEAAGIAVLEIGIEHGTVVAHFGHKLFQITTLRVDVETYGRHAKVAYTDDWAADASRRDFTMNALYADLGGNVFDPLDGMPDVEVRRIRFIGNAHERIEEDALRIMRFFRFHAQFDSSAFDPVGLAACQSHFDLIANLAGERIREELFKILVAPGAAKVICGRDCEGFVECVLPELPDLAATYCFQVMLEVEDSCGSPDPLRRLVSLIDFDRLTFSTGFDVHKAAKNISTRLRFSGKQRVRLERMIARPPELQPHVAKSKKDRGARSGNATNEANFSSNREKVYLYELGPDAWRDAVLLNWALHLNREVEGWSDGALEYFDKISNQAWLALLQLPERWPIPEFPIRGADVIATGVPEGPEVSRLLKEVENWWIEGGFVAERNRCLEELARRADA